MKKALLIGLLLFAFGASSEETVTEKMETSGDNVKRETKQNFRKAKKKLRVKKNRKQDLKDAAKEASEDVSDKAKEIERKVD